MREYKSSRAKFRGEKHGWYAVVEYIEHGKRRETARHLSAIPPSNIQKYRKLAEQHAASWKDELKNRQQEVMEEHRQHLGILLPSNTVESALNVYLGVKSPLVARSTMRGYRDRQKRINDTLGSFKLEELTALVLSRWLTDLNKRYAKNTVEPTLQLVKAMLNFVVEEGVLVKNPAARLTSSSLESRDALGDEDVDEEPREDNAFLEQRELSRLQSDLDESPLSGGVVATQIAIYTGMRASEICALRWKDISFSSNTIIVRRAIGRGEHDCTYIKTTKTRESTRAIPLSRTLKNLLATWKRAILADCNNAGRTFAKTMYVVGGIDGSYLKPQSLSRNFSRRRKRLGLVNTNGKPAVFHQLRHTFVSMMAANGTDMKTLMSLTGDNADTLRKFYLGQSVEVQRAAIDELDAALS